MVSHRHHRGPAGSHEESGPAPFGHVYRDLRRRHGRSGRAAGRHGRAHVAGPFGPSGRTGHVPLHPCHEGRDERRRVRFPEAGAGRPRPVRAPA